MELLLPLEEQIILEFPYRPDISFLTVYQRSHPQATGHKSIMLQLQVER